MFEEYIALGNPVYNIIAIYSIIMTACYWLLFERVGEKGWKALIPFYNIYIFVKVAGRPWWWIFGLPVLLIPFLGLLLIFVWFFFLCKSLALHFGKGSAFAFGLTFLGFIFLPILIYSDSDYKTIL